MAGSTTGQSTLTEIKRQIERAQSVEKAGFFGDYEGGNGVPAGYKDIDSDIQRTHKDHIAVFEEYLEYWNDNNISHTYSASRRFKTTLLNMDDLIKKLNSRMGQKINETNKKTRSHP
jgi:hypothetical protein